MVILIDNGHGQNTPGKCSPDAGLGLKDSPLYYEEWAWCRQLARSVVDVLQAEGYDARLIVPEDDDIPLKDRVRRVNALCSCYGDNNVILISLHSNAGTGKTTEWQDAHGWSIYTTKGFTESDILARDFYRQAKAVFKAPQTVRRYSNSEWGDDFEENFYILRNTRCPAVLIENFFHTNKVDTAYLLSNKGLGECLEVVVQGVEDYIKGRE